MKSADDPPSPFARRLFAVLCGWIALSVAVGVVRAPGGQRIALHDIRAGHTGGDSIETWPAR